MYLTTRQDHGRGWKFKAKSLLNLSQPIQAYFIAVKITFWKVDTLIQMSNSMEFPDWQV